MRTLTVRRDGRTLAGELLRQRHDVMWKEASGRGTIVLNVGDYYTITIYTSYTRVFFQVNPTEGAQARCTPEDIQTWTRQADTWVDRASAVIHRRRYGIIQQS